MATQRVLRRFPYNLSIGTDICHVDRIRTLLASSLGKRFVHKILTAEERGHPKLQRFLSRPNTSLGNMGVELTTEELQTAATFMAGRYILESWLYSTIEFRILLTASHRFAAKEAVIKAHPRRSLTWHDIVVTSQPSTQAETAGAPMAIVRGEDQDYEALLSISHDGEFATAVCLGTPAL